MQRYEEKGKRFTFPAEEKLKSKKLIDRLFTDGKPIPAQPVRLVYLEAPDLDLKLPQTLFSVSKRNFRHAVDRNRIKRQMREVYRLAKHQYFPDGGSNSFLLGFIYVSREKIPYKILEKKLNLTLERLRKTPGNPG